MHARIKVIVPLGEAAPQGKPWWDMLRAVGFDVQLLHGVLDGLWQLRGDPGDLLIVDGAVTDIPPAGLVDALRLDDRTQRLPLILVEPPDGMAREDLSHVIPRGAQPEEVVALVEEVLHAGSPGRTALSPSGVGVGPHAMNRMFRNPALELSLLRLASEQVAEGRTFMALGTLMVNELVSRVGLEWARLWRRDSARSLWTLVAEQVASQISAPGGMAAVERTAATGRTEVHRDEGEEVVTVPLFLRGRVEAMLQLGGTARARSEPKALAERLSLFLALALGREQESETLEKTVNELDLVYEMASATRYTLNLEHVARFALDCLHRLVDYDVAGLLVLDDPANLTIRRRPRVGEDLVRRARTHIMTTLKINCGLELAADVVTRVEEVTGVARESPDKLRSFVNVPLTVGGAVGGMIHVSSARENAFSARDIELLDRLSGLLANSIQGVRDVLAAVKGRVEQMVDHMTDGVLMLDRRGEVVAMNGAARAILKMEGASSGGTKTEDLARGLGFDPMAEMRAERRSLRKLVWVDASAYQAQLSPVEDSEGGLAGVVVAFRNFTEEKRLDVMKSEFIHIVSHELRSPLAAVKNAMDLVLSPTLGGLNEKQARFLELARGSVEHVLELVNELMELSRMEAGKTRVVLTPIALGAPIASVVTALGPRAEAKEIRLLTNVEPELPLVYGERALVERVLVNLVENAIKFTGQGGRVEVEARSTWEEWGSLKRRSVAVTVTDTGRGIPKEQLESIFDKLHQLGRPRDDARRPGFGLPMSRELVSAHHGRIWAESELGRGSRFTFVIPVLTETEVFFRGLDREVDRARRLPAPLALVLIRLRDHERVAKELGDAQYESLLRELDFCARRTIRRSTDRVQLRPEAGEIAALLLDTPHRGGEAFGERLGQELRAIAARAGVEFEFSSGCAVFPEDAATAARLYQLANERAIGRA